MWNALADYCSFGPKWVLKDQFRHLASTISKFFRLCNESELTETLTRLWPNVNINYFKDLVCLMSKPQKKKDEQNILTHNKTSPLNKMSSLCHHLAQMSPTLFYTLKLSSDVSVTHTHTHTHTLTLTHDSHRARVNYACCLLPAHPGQSWRV